MAEHCSKAVSVALGCSDHNLVALTRKTKIPKAGPKVIYRRSYRGFNQDSFVDEIKNVQWLEVCSEDDPEMCGGSFLYYQLRSDKLFTQVRVIIKQNL